MKQAGGILKIILYISYNIISSDGLIECAGTGYKKSDVSGEIIT
jgi:hypothetical protein